MLTFLAIISSVILIIDADSRFFIGVYDSPLGESYQAYPLDKCIVIEVTLADQVYGEFTCNDAGDEVTFYEYKDDKSCNDRSKRKDAVKYPFDDSIKMGEAFSFNCEGSDDYLYVFVFKDDDTCCDQSEDHGTNKIATGVCTAEYDDDLELMEDGSWSTTFCDATMGGKLIFASESECDDFYAGDNPDYEQFSSYYPDGCQFYEEIFGIKVYLSMDRCVWNDTAVVLNEMCDLYYVTSTEYPEVPTEYQTPAPGGVVTTGSSDDSGNMVYSVVAIIIAVFISLL